MANWQMAIVAVKRVNSGAGRFRNPVDIRIFDRDIQPTEQAKTGRGRSVILEASWGNLDSRRHGPRSEYGRALADAEKMLAQLRNGEMLSTSIAAGASA